MRALLALLLLAAAVLVAGCSEESADPEMPMPDLVGMSVREAETEVYDVLHTSLMYYDLSPLDRDAANDWVVVGTTPAAGEPTPMYLKVYAFALRKSEFEWFAQHPTMPRVPARADVAKLLAPGGLLAGVKDLVRVRYAPGATPPGAATDAADQAAFDPDRGLRPDLATEPDGEWKERAGLLVAPARGTIAAGTRPEARSALRTGRLIVLLVRTKPKSVGLPKQQDKQLPASTSGSSSTKANTSGGSGSGSSGGIPGLGNLPGLPKNFPTKPPRCPRQLCG